jgi:hypothetical protein
LARANEVDRAEQLGLQFDSNPADDQDAGAVDAQVPPVVEPEG